VGFVRGALRPRSRRGRAAAVARLAARNPGENAQGGLQTAPAEDEEADDGTFRTCLVFLGVLGVVPDNYWVTLPRKERGRLAAEMAVLRSDGLAPLRYMLAICGLLIAGQAVPALLLTIPDCFLGHEPGASLQALGINTFFALVGIGMIRGALAWPPAQARAEVPKRPVSLAAPSCRKEVEFLERAWKL